MKKSYENRKSHERVKRTWKFNESVMAWRDKTESAMEFATDTVKMEQGLNPVLRVILEGVYDNGSSFSKLRGKPHIIKVIWKNISSYWKSLIHIGIAMGIATPSFVLKFEKIAFPKPKNLNINMMPFVMACNFEDCHLPKYLRSYWKRLIRPLLYHMKIDGHQYDACDVICGHPYNANDKIEVGKICFLTIHESHVSYNQTQRRPGLHTDNPGTVIIEEEGTSAQEKITLKEKGYDGKGLHHCMAHNERMATNWGMGVIFRRTQVQGGIYMASNIDNSCEVWNSQVLCDKNKEDMEIIGKHGDIEHLRSYLGPSTMMMPNTMYWITDRTPHESLPLKKAAYRQYFRLVTHQVSLWFEDHSTKNPLGVLPDPSITKIVKGSKFGDPRQLRVISDFHQNEGIQKSDGKSHKKSSATDKMKNFFGKSVFPVRR